MLVRKLQPLRRLRAVRCVYLGSAVAGSCRDETWSLAGRGSLLPPGHLARWSDMWVFVILVRPASASLLGQVALVVLGFAASGLDPLRVGCVASSLGVRLCALRLWRGLRVCRAWLRWVLIGGFLRCWHPSVARLAGVRVRGLHRVLASGAVIVPLSFPRMSWALRFGRLSGFVGLAFAA